MSALDRLKNIQSNFKRTWTGVDCVLCGRTGTSNFVNKKRTFAIPDSFYEEEERQKTLLKIFTKLRDLEDDKLFQTSLNKTAMNSTGQSGFFTGNPSSTA